MLLQVYILSLSPDRTKTETVLKTKFIFLSRTPLKGTPDVDLKLVQPKKSPQNLPPRSHTPMYVPGKENLLLYKNSPKVGYKTGSKTPPGERKVMNNKNLMCTPCKQSKLGSDITKLKSFQLCDSDRLRADMKSDSANSYQKSLLLYGLKTPYQNEHDARE